MAKVTIKAECLNQSNTKNGSNAAFVVKSEKQAPAAPGQPERINAKRAVQVNFDDDTASQFKPGKHYTITIEG